MGVGVIFTGCNTTDLSGINAEIDSLKQQITSLNQTITDLQSRLNDAEGDVSSLQSQLAISIANYNELYNRVYGQTSNYKSVGDTWTYSVDGIKIFDFTIESAIFNTATQEHYMYYDFISYSDGLNNLEDVQLGISFLLYDPNTNEAYKTTAFREDLINFERNIPDETRNGLLFVYLGNTIVTVYDLDFDEIAS